MEKNAKTLFWNNKYQQSLKIFLRLDSLVPDHGEINYYIGLSYLQVSEKSKALEYLNKARALNFQSPNLIYNLALANHLNYNFDLSVAQFEEYKKLIKGKDKTSLKRISEIDRRIQIAKNGKELISSPVEISIENLGEKINSPYPDYVPLLNAEENSMVFTSRRPGSTGGTMDKVTGFFYEDIYSSFKDSAGRWQAPQNIGNPVNTVGHDACIALSSDARQLYIYKDQNNGDIFVSNFEGKKWSNPAPLPDYINSAYSEPSACVSWDNNYLFFVSDKPGGLGGKDIYVSESNNKDGKWSVPRNLGPKVNTPFDEDSPFIHPNRKTLYFSSEGHQTMGGYDIFTTDINLDSFSFSNPVNIGYPVNTTQDDLYFVWSADGKRAYFSSTREGGYGEKDIYRMIKPNTKVSLIMIKGKTFSATDTSVVESTLYLTDNETGKLIGEYRSNETSGKFVIMVPPGKNYGISVQTPAYLPYSQNIDIPDSGEYVEIENNIYLQEVKKGSILVLRNVFFDTGSASLKKESFTELDNFVKLLTQNTNLYVEVAGHTDNVGDMKSNLRLSEDRSKAVVYYLISKGVSPERLLSIGYGEQFPIKDNISEQGRKENRRTEMIIIDTINKNVNSNNSGGYYYNNKRK